MWHQCHKVGSETAAVIDAASSNAARDVQVTLIPQEAVFVSKHHSKQRRVPRSGSLKQKMSLALSLMRLLDLIAQGRTELIRVDDGRSLPGAERFRDAVRNCPLRYVLVDELTRCATQMAFSEGDRLTSCLDLIHVPAQSLWIEWTDAAHRIDLPPIRAHALQGSNAAQRAGALLKASSNGRAGEIRTFWSTRAELAYVSPVVIRFDLDGVREQEKSADPVVGCGWATLTAPLESGLEEFLEHLRFHFDEEWAAYYRDRCETREMRVAVLRHNLATCAFDPPMLFAFLLMLSARSALPQRAIAMDKLNRARRRAGKPALLEHVEVSAPLYSSSTASMPRTRGPQRRGPRLHHVSGHIVRRGAAVFWRVPHLRGSARLGQVRTRTVELSYVPRVG